MSRLDLLAGPNGAGKTTFFERAIEPARPGLPFVNAGRIAAHKFPGAEAERSYEAAEISARAHQALIDARLDFCTETVFSHPTKSDLIATAVTAGYDVILHVLMIPLSLSGDHGWPLESTQAAMTYPPPNSPPATNASGR